MTEFKCPYCFHKMTDEDVCFRSARVSKPSDNPIIEYEDVNQFHLQYTGADKEQKLKDYYFWDYFLEADDEVYTAFWSQFNGTTEKDTLMARTTNVKEYRRKVINPDKTAFVKEQANGSKLIRDEHGMVVAIDLVSGERCTSRVCPNCHNPLPNGYGKYPTKFITMVGVSGAGKTVYLSQLLRNIGTYLARIGVALIPTNAATNEFVERNRIQQGQRLPGSTPAHSFEQPLCFQLTINTPNGQPQSQTLILYDVAGEILQEHGDYVNQFAPFIRHADGIIYLTAPEQFDNIAAAKQIKQVFDPTTALNVIQGLLKEGEDNRIEVPMAITLSKVDTRQVIATMEAAGGDCSAVMEDLEPVRAKNGLFERLFNADGYNTLGRSLALFMNQSAINLSTILHSSFQDYMYFAVSSLGCDCITKEIDGVEVMVPEYVPTPKRIEEPLYWLMYHFKLIDIRGELYLPNADIERCPICNRMKVQNYDFKEDERFKGLLNAVKRMQAPERYHNRICAACRSTWAKI